MNWILPVALGTGVLLLLGAVNRTRGQRTPAAAWQPRLDWVETPVQPDGDMGLLQTFEVRHVKRAGEMRIYHLYVGQTMPNEWRMSILNEFNERVHGPEVHATKQAAMQSAEAFIFGGPQ
jgi:hypothetical protein